MRSREAQEEGEPADETSGETDEKFVKEWRQKRTSAVPARIFQDKNLGVDEELKLRIAAPRGPRIRSHLVGLLVPIGRRMLEVAISEAVSQMELHPRQREWELEWSRIAETSRDAVKALERLLRAINPQGEDPKHIARFIVQSRAGGFEASTAGYRDAAESALEDARSLVAAKRYWASCTWIR
jgi:hypothetical protein